ncbi:MAG: hypothetical protein M3067_14835 [Chloroflexota bacterium]|nr:hypothetical protein [Chloroflexota bacterium]
MIGSIVRGAWRLFRGITRALGRAIRDTAEPAGIAQTMNDEGLSHPSAMGGVMMIGAARRIGEASNRAADTDKEETEGR